MGTSIDTEKIARQLANLAAGSHPDSVRLHIPRALRVVYDVRNNRDAAHLADGIDPNLQDATLVVAVLDWVLAEFVRLYHNVSANEAQRLVEEIVTRVAPTIQDFDGFVKVLKTGLTASSFILLVLYHRGQDGATLEQLEKWAPAPLRRSLRRTLHRLINDHAFVHGDVKRCEITQSGQREVERLGLIRV